MHEAVKLVREEQLLRLLLAGYMLRECAVQMKISYRTVRLYAHDTGFLMKLKSLSKEIYARVDGELQANADDIMSKLESYSMEALDEMMELARAEKGMTKLKACQDIMDRNPQVSRTKRIEATNDHNFISPLFLVHAAATAKEVERLAIPAMKTEEEPDAGK
jgi:hypothetical protein